MFWRFYDVFVIKAIYTDGIMLQVKKHFKSAVVKNSSFLQLESVGRIRKTILQQDTQVQQQRIAQRKVIQLPSICRKNVDTVFFNAERYNERTVAIHRPYHWIPYFL